VVAILDRAGQLTHQEARALNAAIRERPDLEDLAALILDAHQRYLNYWAMFDNWAHPYDEMVEARRRVAVALGSVPARPLLGLQPDDGSVDWGAATAAAYAVLGSGLASAEPRLKEPWELVMRGVESEGPIAEG
jgi:hypothetical protein